MYEKLFLIGESIVCKWRKNIVKEKDNLCPKCGSELVLRVAKQGINKGNEFYGCSSYPKCRHTLAIIKE